MTLALIFSGALNIGLIAAGVFSALSNKQDSFAAPLAMKPDRQGKSGESTNLGVIESFSKLGFRELVSYLTNRDLVEEGYTKRDLAVSALVAYHHFNLEKALGSAPVQERELKTPQGKELSLYPGLNEEQFDAIIRFAYQEKWPLTAEGLFQIVKNRTKPRDQSLEQAFCVTPEFHTVQTLFQKTESIQPTSLLIDLICEGSWDLLNRFSHEQSHMLDLSVDKRRRLLLSYLALQSPIAAQLLLTTDFAFALKRLEDQGILDLVGLLNKTPEAERFCIELLRSPRSDGIWHAAAERLYNFVGEAIPGPIDLRTARIRFTGSAPPLPLIGTPAPISIAQPTVEKNGGKFHVVKEGESLWKISRLYKVPVDQIVKANGMEKDRLYPGMTLKIPAPSQGTGSEPPR